MYLLHSESPQDVGVTVLQEFIRARDEVIERYAAVKNVLDRDLEEVRMEEEAVRTHHRSKHVLMFIVELCCLRINSRISVQVIPKMYLLIRTKCAG